MTFYLHDIISKKGGDLGFLWSLVPVSSSSTGQQGESSAVFRYGESCGVVLQVNLQTGLRPHDHGLHLACSSETRRQRVWRKMGFRHSGSASSSPSGNHVGSSVLVKQRVGWRGR